MSTKDLAKAEARAQGAQKYFGAPCKYGHIGLRFTRSGACVECNGLRHERQYSVRSETPGTKEARAVNITKAAWIHARASWRTYRNVTGSLPLLVEMFSTVPYITVASRIDRGWPLGAALKTPLCRPWEKRREMACV